MIVESEQDSEKNATVMTYELFAWYEPLLMTSEDLLIRLRI